MNIIVELTTLVLSIINLVVWVMILKKQQVQVTVVLLNTSGRDALPVSSAIHHEAIIGPGGLLQYVNDAGVEASLYMPELKDNAGIVADVYVVPRGSQQKKGY